MKFRKKPVVINAFKWNGDSDDLWAWMRDECGVCFSDAVKHMYRTVTDYTKGPLIIRTLEGEMKADIGDWIIQGVKGEFYPCKPDIFEATYEKVEE